MWVSLDAAPTAAPPNERDKPAAGGEREHHRAVDVEHEQRRAADAKGNTNDDRIHIHKIVPVERDTADENDTEAEAERSEGAEEEPAHDGIRVARA